MYALDTIQVSALVRISSASFRSLLTATSKDPDVNLTDFPLSHNQDYNLSFLIQS